MKCQRFLVNAGLFALTLLLTFLLIDTVVGRTKLVDGLPLREYLADEFRIRFLPVHDNNNYGCNNNSGGLIPLCEGTFNGAHVRIPAYHVSINSFGIRDKEYALEKPQGTYRIFVLGDSNTFGEGVDIEEVYTELLEEELNRRYEARFELFNLGVGGMSTDNEYLRLLQYWNYSPDLIVLQSHPNDILECGSMKEEIDGLIEESLGINLSDDIHDEFSARLERNRLREEYARQLGEEKRCACILEGLGAITALTGQERIPLIILELDYQQGYSCFDSEDESYSRVELAYLGREYRLSRSDAHLNAAGHEKVAEILLPEILGVINAHRPAVLSSPP